jgi:hypothetical protein
MNSLANSLWSVECTGSEIGTDVIRFFEGGKAVVAFPDGSTAKGCWAETSKGHFIFQSPCKSADAQARQVYVGVHEAEEANGQWFDSNSIVHRFTMKKES